MAKTLRRIASAVVKTMMIKRSYPPMTTTQADAAKMSLPLRFLWSLRWGPKTRTSPLQLNNYELFCLQNLKLLTLGIKYITKSFRISRDI